MEITEQGAQSLQMKMRNAELYLKGALVIQLRLAARMPELASTRVNVGKNRLLLLILLRIQERLAEQAFN